MAENPYLSIFNVMTTPMLAELYLLMLEQVTEHPQDPVTPSNIRILLRYILHLGDDAARRFEQLVGRKAIKLQFKEWSVEE